MTDVANVQTSTKGWSRAGMGGILLAATPQIHPLLVTWITAHYPIVGSTLAEIIVGGFESFIGGYVIYWTPRSAVQSVTDLIVFCKEAISQWRSAWNAKE